MLQKLSLGLLIVISLAFVQAEKYYVTFIKGAVTVKKTGKALKVGDVLSPTDALVFKDATGKVSCISPGKGRFDINAGSLKSGGGSELLAVLKNNLVPSTSSYRLSTRSLAFEGYEPKSYFQSAETGNRILLLKDLPVQINAAYPITESSFFFVQYTENGKTQTKKLQQDSKGIVFADGVFPTSVDKVMLCYQDKSSGTARSSMLASFTPILVSKEEVIEQVRVIKLNSAGFDAKKLKEQIAAHLYDNYGKISLQEIEALLP
ncbi:MAG: hypothetical protein V4687_09905 [Bacteroidota bacterium]